MKVSGKCAWFQGKSFCSLLTLWRGKGSSQEVLYIIKILKPIYVELALLP